MDGLCGRERRNMRGEAAKWEIEMRRRKDEG